MNSTQKQFPISPWGGLRLSRTVLGAALLLLVGVPNQSFSSIANFGYFWKNNTFPYDTEFSYFFDVAVYPDGVFADQNQHYYAYITAQNKHIIYNSVPYGVEVVLQYGYNANNAQSIKRVWMSDYKDPTRFTNPWIDGDADGIDYWELSTLDANGYLVTERDGHSEYLKFLEVQAQTIFVSETTNPVQSVWENRFYFFNSKTQQWDKKVSNSFVIPASREAVRLATYSTGSGIWAGILETDGDPNGLDHGKPPVKNIVYKSRSVKVVDHGVTSTAPLNSSNNTWIAPNSPYQLLHSSTGDYSEFVAGPSNCIIAVQASPLAGGQVNGGGVYPNNSMIQLSATPTNGYAFVNWTENGITVSNLSAFNFVWAGYRSLVANFSSTFRIDSVGGSLANGLTIHWIGWSGFGYQVQYSRSLQANDWHDLGGEQTVPTGPTPMSHTNLPAASEDRRFYRVVRTVRP